MDLLAEGERFELAADGHDIHVVDGGSGVGHRIEQVGHGDVVECDGRDRAPLADDQHVLEVERVVGVRLAEAGHLGRPSVTQVLELQPGERRKHQRPHQGPVRRH